MKYAKSSSGERIVATRGIKGLCPSCGASVVPKCGKIKVHHWAHEMGSDCDAWSEPETNWHREWKDLFRPQQIEVCMGPHRADVVTSQGQVIELQNSPISPSEIRDREEFYKDMIWVVNAMRFADRFFLMRRLDGNVFTFKWKHMKSSWMFAKCPVYLDFGDIAIKDLLGATQSESSEFYSRDGDHQSFERTKIVRYDAKAGTQLDKSMRGLDGDLLHRGMLKIKTLHESGRGSALPVSHLNFKQRLGVDDSKLFNMAAIR